MNLCTMSIMPVGAIFYGFLYDFELYWMINIISAILMLAVVRIFFKEGLIAKSKSMYATAKQEAEEADDEPEEESHPEPTPQSV
ncbi:hypothetical protein [Salinicoccus sp. CNSTN-B1]